MPSFLLHKPHIMLLAEWEPQSDDMFKPSPPGSDVVVKKGFNLTLKKPCPFVEHWDVVETIPAAEHRQNANGKF